MTYHYVLFITSIFLCFRFSLPLSVLLQPVQSPTSDTLHWRLQSLHLEKNIAFFASCSHARTVYPAKFLSHVNDKNTMYGNLSKWAKFIPWNICIMQRYRWVGRKFCPAKILGYTLSHTIIVWWFSCMTVWFMRGSLQLAPITMIGNWQLHCVIIIVMFVLQS